MSAAGTADTESHVVLPDGAMDVIATMHEDGSLDDAFVVGAMTRPLEAQLLTQSLVGIRFLPGAGGSALGANATELTDSQCALAELLSVRSPAFDALRVLTSRPDSAHACHEFIVSLGVERRSMPSLISAATRLLAEAPRRVRVDKVADQLGVSRQHLARTFSANSGLSPKQFATICRVRALLANVHKTTALRAKSDCQWSRNEPKRIQWSEVALQYGYSDQSHLIADVRAVTGYTPAAWERAAGSIIPILPVPVGAL